MSWDIYLERLPGKVLPAPDGHSEGGTFVKGGTNLCELNVTYNYGWLLRCLSVHPIDDLHGSKGVETSEALTMVANDLAKLSHGECDDYWHGCTNNVARCVSLLASWAQWWPEGTWRVT